MNKNALKVLGIASIASSVLLGCGGSKLTPRLQTVKNNYTEMILDSTSTKSYEDKSIDEIMKTISVKKISGYDTYYFNDIDYRTSEERASFSAGAHLSRTKQIAVLAKKTNNSKLMDIAIKLVQHWVLSNYRSVNWWHNEIGCNGNLTDIGIILFDKLDSFIQDAFRGKVDESSFYHRPQLMTHEGSNLINYINMSLKNSVFDNNEEEYKLCNNKTKDILKTTGRQNEGFMKDGSFHQHGTEMQTGAYGLEAVGNIGKILVATRGTNFEMPKEQLEVISNFVLNGISGISHKGKFNFMGLNRAYTRPNTATPVNNGGFKELRYFEYYNDLPKKDEYKETLDNIDNGKETFKGIKLFPDSNFIAANIDGVYMSFMSANANGRVTESTNAENQLGYNFAWGNNTCVMDTGNEYFNIAPVWDYSRLPGCTSPIFKSDESIRKYTIDVGNAQYATRLPFKSPKDGTTDCVYNFSETLNNGVAYSMCQSYKDVMYKDGKAITDSGNKFTITCFTTEDGMVIVGSGFDIGKSNKEKLSGLVEDDKQYTTVEQCIADDKQISDPEDVQSYTNGNVVYSALGSGDNLTCEVKEQIGTYQRNNPNGNYTKDEQKHKVLTVTYKPANGVTDNSYAYSIQPKSKVDKKIFKLAANTEDVQAIELPNGKIAACFYKNAGKFIYEGKTYTRDITKTFDTTKGQFEIMDK